MSSRGPFRRIVAAIALVGVLLHGGLASLHLADRADPVGSLMALGGICFAGSTAAGLPADTPLIPDSSPGKTPRKVCPICTALAGINLAPPLSEAMLVPPSVISLAGGLESWSEPRNLRTERSRARDPPSFA